MAIAIAKDRVNLRTGPSTSDSVIRVIIPTTQLTILETTGDWLKVQADDATIGYVMGQFFDIQNTAPVAAPTSSPVATVGASPAPTAVSSPAPIDSTSAAAPTPVVTISGNPTPTVVSNPTPTDPTAASAPTVVVTISGTTPPATVSSVAPVDPTPATVASNPAPTAATAPTPATTSSTAPAAVPVSSKLLGFPGDTLNVRSTPAIVTSPDNKIETLLNGAIMTPLEDDATLATKVGSTRDQGLWIQVRTASGNTGYVAAWLVIYASAPVVSPTTQPTSQPVVTPSSGGTSETGGTANSRSLQPELNTYIDSIPNNYTIPQGYNDFWAQSQKLGLPDPFDISPTKLNATSLSHMLVNGFGPNTFSALNWNQYYKNVCGMHNGLDHIVPVGTPLVAVSDGIIVGNQTNWRYMGNADDKDIILWCFLPEQYKDNQGRRMLSNVLVAYSHMSDNTVVKRHDVVQVGQTIGISGNPAGETNNAHLHLEVHLLSGDNNLPRPSGRKLNVDYKPVQPFGNITPFNPLLFFSERLVKYHQHQGKKIGFNGGPTYPNAAQLSSMGLNWPPLDFFTLASFQYGSPVIWTVSRLPWPKGIYDLPTLNQRIANYTAFDPYPADFL
ncbi:MAG: SH3 domain-containing protein [Chloroflexota bacterium]